MTGPPMQAHSSIGSRQGLRRDRRRMQRSQQEGNSAAPPVVVEKKIYIEKPIYFPESAGSEQTNPAEAVASATSKG